MQPDIPIIRQTPRRITRVARASPIEEARQSVLPGVVGLHLHGLRVVVSDETSISSDTISRPNVLIHMLLRAGSWQILEFKSTFFARMPGVWMPNGMRAQERTSVSRNAQKDFIGRNALLDHIRHGGVARNSSVIVVGLLRGE